MLTRAEFDAACKIIVNHSPLPALTGWSWTEHPSLLGFGFLSRTVHHFRRPQSSLTDQRHVIQEDEAEADIKDVPETLVSQQYVVYSPTFRVPTFYFSIHDSMGSPLILADLIHTTLFHPFAFEHTKLSTFGITHSQSSFPVLSQGEHPNLGTPCWYLHPCATEQAVAELLDVAEAADINPGKDDAEMVRLRRWLEIWFMVLGSAVNTRP
ncbi:Ubiquitin-like-conjugating enzyme ATG10 [Termitomyces sp. T112]|nr:Ubiquitin-like-conjugating enzyme ATG10 [Termitomyces sp. T112]